MKGKIKIRIIKDDEDLKIDEVMFTDESYANYLIKEGIAKKIDEEREKEAKFYRDKSVLENHSLSDVDKASAQIFLKVSKENFERLIEKKYTLNDIHNYYKNNFHIEDTNRIDVFLATALSNKLDGLPIWLIIVGASGDMKSVQLNSLRGEDVMVLHNLTSKTLVNGYRDKGKYPDLAPELKNKIIIIPDMAQILKLPPIEKGELWGQLRDLYDGLAGKLSGQGSRAQYEGIKVTLIAGSTPAIDGQILVHQDLGTRELIYRTKGIIKKRKSMLKCFDNESCEEKIKEELKDITSNFLNNIKVVRKDLSQEEMEKLMNISMFLSVMRTTADFDSYTNELRNDAFPEEPTRIAKQLKRLFLCLMNLDENYSSDNAFEILWHIAKSSAFPLRVKVFRHFLNNNEKESTISEISDILNLGKSTVKREINLLWNLKILIVRRETIDSRYPDRTYDYWRLNKDNEFVKESINKYRPYI